MWAPEVILLIVTSHVKRFVSACFVTTARFVTTRTERSTRCTFCHSFASNTVTCLFLSPQLCVCVRVCVCVCVCVCARARALTCACLCVPARTCMCVCLDVHLSVAARALACVWLRIVFIIPASISPKLKFCIAYEATAARSSVSCVKYDYRYRD